MARFLVDLHDSRSVFNFCGGMMFQLVLSDKLREHLITESETGVRPTVVVYDSSVTRMSKISGYRKDAGADNRRLFHGREIRKVASAAGGMGFVLHLSYAGDEVDREGWTGQEVDEYNGWTHDSGRRWRSCDLLESEGFSEFRSKFGTEAFSLHHRFYLHLDSKNYLWLSAEDGCEGRGPVIALQG